MEEQAEFERSTSRAIETRKQIELEKEKDMDRRRIENEIRNTPEMRLEQDRLEREAPRKEMDLLKKDEEGTQKEQADKLRLEEMTRSGLAKVGDLTLAKGRIETKAIENESIEKQRIEDVLVEERISKDSIEKQTIIYERVEGSHVGQNQSVQAQIDDSKTDIEGLIALEVERRLGEERMRNEGIKQQLELEKKMADIEREIQKRAARRRRRERSSSSEYKEEEQRRSRERSKGREEERARARKEEVENFRKATGLDDKSGKWRSVLFVLRPDEDIGARFERAYLIPNGIPRLTQTPPTPPPGKMRGEIIVHVEGDFSSFVID
ncbi:hypothetical protein RUND412_000893 [Rhizina undulata]